MKTGILVNKSDNKMVTAIDLELQLGLKLKVRRRVGGS